MEDDGLVLVSILGCPCSGKTTTAAMAFAELKQSGFLTEFITEQARYYIAKKRVELEASPKEVIKLNDDDQLCIMTKQTEMEEIYKKACDPSTIILCDSSSLNALLYMSDDFLSDQRVQENIQKALSQYDMVFYATPLEGFSAYDSNRVHDKAFSESFDQRLPDFCLKHLPSLNISNALVGDPQARMSTLVDGILHRYLLT